MRRVIIALLPPLLVWPVVLPAQDYGTGGWAVPSLGTTIDITNDVLAREIGPKAVLDGIARKGATRRAPAPATATPSRSTSALPIETRFRRSPEASAAAKQALVERVRQRNPAEAEPLAKQLATLDPARGFESIVAPYGLSGDDMADTLTAYWVMGWIVANRTELPSPAAVKAARAQVAGTIGTTALAEKDDRQRNLASDEALYAFMTLNVAWRGRESDPATYRRNSDLVQRDFLAKGMDLRAMTLTETGFARTGG